ncbi:hypothetical protein GCM10020295_08380 [Streptomyces cinereospinus]
MDGVDVEGAVVVRGVEEQALLERGERPHVGDAAGGEPFHPRPFLLGQGEGRTGRRRRGGLLGGDRRRQRRRGAVFEDVTGVERQARAAGPAGDGDGADAVAAEQEEVVVGADVGEPEDGGEDLREQPLRAGARGAGGGPYGPRGGQRGPVQLAAGGVSGRAPRTT